MRIAIEATLVQGRPTGLGHYVNSLLQALAALETGHEFILLYATKKWTGPDYGRNFTPVSYHFAKQSLAIQYKLNHVIRESGADIFHATCTTGVPPHCTVPVITTIHDIYPITHPGNCRLVNRLFFKYLLRWTVKNTDLYIFNSNFTRSEFTKQFNIADIPQAVTHLGASNRCTQSQDIERAKHAPIICVGAIEPRKGQLFFLDAYRQALQSRPELPELIFVGPDRGNGTELQNNIEAYGLKKKVSWTAYLEGADLRALYRTASLMVFPSNYEGFGIPVLEAISFRLPLMCSDIEVLREVGGEYPIYAACCDIADWKEKILQFFSSSEAFDSSSAEKILSDFSWENCARQTLECYIQLYDTVYRK